ncbi:MAG TPA: hypothetical protein VGE57_01100 [Solimonas sp.]
MNLPLRMVVGSALALLAACSSNKPASTDAKPGAAGVVDRIAADYVRQALALGEHDPHYVDAYHGDPAVREAVRAARPGLDAIITTARRQIVQLDGMLYDRAPAAERLRHEHLRRQLQALVARAEQVRGRPFSFEAEAHALYDVDVTRPSEDELRARLAPLEALLPPGRGTLADRYNAYLDRFAIAPDKLEAVMRAAIEEARRRTQARIALPAEEHFELALVSGKSWSAYNWYQGEYRSRIEINTDLPVTMTRAIELAVHEGYPGHHVYNVLVERELLRKRGWVEFGVYPLFSPQSLIAEGSADYAVALAFPLAERVAFVRDTLFPLAGFDPQEAERYVTIAEAGRATGAATIEAARRYLDGQANAEATVRFLRQYALASEARARQRLQFFDDYRAYIVNYSLGETLVTQAMAPYADADAATRWRAFETLLSLPRLPSALTR